MLNACRCRNRDFATIIPHQPAKYRERHNEVFLDFEAFLLSTMKERSTLWIHSQIKACMDANDCQPVSCDLPLVFCRPTARIEARPIYRVYVDSRYQIPRFSLMNCSRVSSLGVTNFPFYGGEASVAEILLTYPTLLRYRYTNYSSTRHLRNSVFDCTYISFVFIVVQGFRDVHETLVNIARTQYSTTNVPIPYTVTAFQFDTKSTFRAIII